MAKKNTVEIAITAKDEASRAIEKAVRAVSGEFNALNSSLRRTGTDSAEISKINSQLRKTNPKLLEAEINKVRDQLQRMGADAKYIDHVTKNMRDAEKATADLDKKSSSAFSTLAKAAGVAAVAVGAAAAAVVGGVVKMGININAAMEQSQIAWKTLLGSGEDAKKMIQDLRQMGAKTPFEFEGLDKSAKLLSAMGVNSKDLLPVLNTLGDSVSAIGGGQDTLEGVAMAIGQMLTKGKVSAEEMNQLAERGIPAWEMMASKLGISKQELMKLSSQGKIYAEQAIPAMLAAMQEKFGGAMDAQSKTFNGQMSTLKDNVKMVIGEISGPIFDVLKQAMPTVIAAVDQFGNWVTDHMPQIKQGIADAIDAGAAAFNALGDAVKFVMDNANWLIPVVAGLTAAVTAQFVIDKLTTLHKAWKAATIAQTTAQWLLNAALDANPIGLVALAIGVLVTAGILLYKNWDTVKAKTIELWNKLGPLKAVVIGLGGPIASLIAAGVLLYKNWDTIKAKAGELKDKIMEVLKKLPEEALQWGKHLVDGLVKGIGEKIDAAKQKAKELAKSVGDAVTDFFDMHSPSRLMYQNGKYIVEGLALGIEKNSGKATAKAKQLAEKVAKEAQKAAKAFDNLKFDVSKAGKKYREDVADVAKDYLSKITDVNSRLREDEKRLTDEYKNQVEQRADALRNFVGLFDEVTSREVTGDGLLKNLRDQVSAFKSWSIDIQKLAARGVDQGLIKELREMGPKAGPEIAALNSLTKEQLLEYVALWKEKAQDANSEALIQLEDLKSETAVKIGELRQAAIAEVDLLLKEWKNKNAELAQNLIDTIKQIEKEFKDATGKSTKFGTDFIQGIIDGAESKYEALVKTVNKIKATMAASGPLDILPAQTISSGMADFYAQAARARAGAKIPGLAEGGTVTSGGVTLVGERGPELLNLPRGSQVIPLEKAAPQQVVHYHTHHYHAPLINHEGDVNIEDGNDAKTYWREREYVAQRLYAEGERA